MSIISDLKKKCKEVRDATEANSNTANKVGQLLLDMVDGLGGEGNKPLTIKLNESPTTYDGSDEKVVIISPENIDAQRIALASNAKSGGLSMHYIDRRNVVRGTVVGNYVLLMRFDKKSNAPLNVVFTVSSKGNGSADNWHAKYRFTSYSYANAALDCIECYDGHGEDPHFAYTDIVATYDMSGYNIYLRARNERYGGVLVNIEMMDTRYALLPTFYTTEAQLKDDERAALPATPECEGQPLDTFDRRGQATLATHEVSGLMSARDKQLFDELIGGGGEEDPEEAMEAMAQRIKNTYKITKISECYVDESGQYIADPTDEMIVVDSATGKNGVRLQSVNLRQGMISPYGANCVIHLTVCNTSGNEVQVEYEYMSVGQVIHRTKANSSGVKDTFVCIEGNWVREY